MARRSASGAPAPLFERLTDEAPAVAGEPRPFRTLDADGLRRSVIAELQRLLNTRRGWAPRRWPHAGTVLGYGVPDHALDNPGSVRDQDELCRDIERAIRAFEPRLREPSVWVTEPVAGRGLLSLGITGTVYLGRRALPVAFATTLTSEGATVADAESPDS